MTNDGFAELGLDESRASRDTRPRSRAGTKRPDARLWFWLTLAAAALLWLVAISRTSDSALGDWGLVAAFPIAWYLALGGVLALCIAALAARPIKDAEVAAALGFLVVVLRASSTLVEDAPRLPWTYKHVAVTSFIDAFGSVHPSIDIYQRWPGFFAAAAAMGEVIGLREPVSYAAWAEVFFALLNVLLVVAVARTLSPQKGWYWTAGLIFAVSDWIGQTYFAPQAFAFVLYLTIVLVALLYLRSRPGSLALKIESALARLAKSRATVPGDLEWVDGDRRARVVAIVATLVLTTVLVATHQLTPYLALLALVPLYLLGYVRPLWVVVAMGLLTLGYLAPNYSFIQEEFGLLSGFNFFENAAAPPADFARVSEAAAWRSTAGIALSVIVVALAVAGLVRRLRSGDVRTALVVGWLATAPVFTLVGQTYGGEGRFRVFLFALPWFSMGAAWLFWPGVRRPIQLVGGILALTSITALFAIAYYQPEADYRVSAADVDAAKWLDRTIEQGDTAIAVSPVFPGYIGSNYPLLGSSHDTTNLSLLSRLGDVNIENLKGYIQLREDTGRAFVIFSDDQANYAERQGLFPRGRIASLESAVAVDPAFHLAYATPEARIYEYRDALQ